ncbi:hypothetical protein BJX61DRAFT_537506 [Aspergillus egyptiacus]|nr:hypothetical protein BJX61DRAFT_537506 [Aspergillus egyptiacus]
MPRSQKSDSAPKQDKNMSSRLLTMKRAAASAASKESSQAATGSESTDSTPKKRRVSSGPESPSVTPSSDLEAISAALAEEENRRKDAIARQAAEAGETEWVLDFAGADTMNQYAQQPLVLADYSLDADDDDVGYGGRQAYGNYKPKNKPKSNNDGDVPVSQETKTKKVNLDNVTAISGAGGRGHPTPSGGNDKAQKKRKHK